MSTFNCCQKPVMTRKPHRCETCCRVIPAGMRAYHTGGMWEGDWQNWYMCGFCHDNNVSASGEEISDEDFNDWLYEQDFAVCPHWCNGKRYSKSWEWTDDRQDVEFECDEIKKCIRCPMWVFHEMAMMPLCNLTGETIPKGSTPQENDCPLVAISKMETTSAKKITVDVQLRPLLDDLEVDIEDVKEYIKKLD